jgi:hypothetical protein
MLNNTGEYTMKMTLDKYDFRTAFESYNRADNYTYYGLEIIFDAFEELDENYELDVIAICSDINEYTVDEFNREYHEEFEDIDEIADYLSGQTWVLGTTSDTVIFQAY